MISPTASCAFSHKLPTAPIVQPQPLDTFPVTLETTSFSTTFCRKLDQAPLAVSPHSTAVSFTESPTSLTRLWSCSFSKTLLRKKLCAPDMAPPTAPLISLKAPPKSRPSADSPSAASAASSLLEPLTAGAFDGAAAASAAAALEDALDEAGPLEAVLEDDDGAVGTTSAAWTSSETLDVFATSVAASVSAGAAELSAIYTLAPRQWRTTG
mmetsp:Transcript_17620/g.31853  ORF Transcript_17620/g.31853 Transcript_17620/m.31853 type:complete len:211 (-) Transcript_17620:16-648(-)